MSTQELGRYTGIMEVPEVPASPPRWAMRLGRSVRAVKRGTVRVVGASVPAALRHLRDHAYAFIGLGSLSAAGFVHSLFTGLIVMGVAWLVLEFKIQLEGEE
jgi:hypothetical protein